jgi:hypothetical protein
VKGASFGFQADVFACIKVDTTFVKQQKEKRQQSVI